MITVLEIIMRLLLVKPKQKAVEFPTGSPVTCSLSEI